MNGIVTQDYLRRRFWVATLALLATLVLTSIVLLAALHKQSATGHFVVAFHHLESSADRLETELARLPRPEVGSAVDRRGIRAALVDLLTRFRMLAHEDGSQPAHGTHLYPEAPGRDHLADLAAEFGVGAARAAAEQGPSEDEMPPDLAAVWLGEGPGGAKSPPLEAVMAGLLRLVVPLARNSGPLTPSEHALVLAAQDSYASTIRPRIATVETLLDNQIQRTYFDAIVFIVALAVLGGAVAVLNFVAIFRPVERAVMQSQSELLAERDKARAADQARRNFVATVSHELRTPLNGILGFASILAASNLSPDQRRQVGIIQASGKALLTLINDLLDLARIEAGAATLRASDFSVAEVIAGVASLMRESALGKGLGIDLDLDGNLPAQARGDGERLRQVLINLVGNAIKFTSSGGVTIRVRWQARGGDATGSVDGQLLLSVSDTGPGIPPEKREAVFERFARLDNVPPGTEGTGLGLAISRQLVEAMGGQIWVEDAAGAGATVVVSLPLAGSENAAPPASVERDPAPGQRMRPPATETLSGLTLAGGSPRRADQSPPVYGDARARCLATVGEAGEPEPMPADLAVVSAGSDRVTSGPSA